MTKNHRFATTSSPIIARVLFPLLALACFHPAISSASGLILGLIYGLVFIHPYQNFNKQWIHRLLSYSIIGIGAGMNLGILAEVGVRGVGYTVTGIFLTMALGLLFGKLFKTPRDLSLLISSGTAICGGSAIAAVSSVIRAKPEAVSTALVIVFLLNSLALLIFPPLGHFFDLDPSQFGLWSALAIHDTSSVVGSSMQFGSEALEVGTTVKLARALWIVPLALTIGWFNRESVKNGNRAPFKKPWFILGFLIAAALVTWVPHLREPGGWIAAVAKRLFVVTLFLIGSGFSRSNLKALSVMPLLQAVVLWLLVSSTTLILISQRFIHY